MAERGTQRQLLEGVARVFHLDAPPERIEVYDNSHIQGTAPVGAMIVAGPDSFIKNSYRKFNIKSEEAAGDDFAMMREVLSRRFGRALKENPERDEEHWPDLVLIDGGQGQLEAARQVMTELGLDDIGLVGIAKGPERKPGLEELIFPDRAEPLTLPADHPGLHLLQQIRDEAHRFAIQGHRARRGKARTTSSLQEITGVGAKRRQALLQHFGGLRALQNASVDDLARVPGISRALAERIYGELR